MNPIDRIEGKPLPIPEAPYIIPDSYFGRTLLVADDNKELRESLVQPLKKAGFYVLEADHGRHALDVLRSINTGLSSTAGKFPQPAAPHGCPLASAAPRAMDIRALNPIQRPILALITDWDMPEYTGSELILHAETTKELGLAKPQHYILMTGHPKSHPPIRELLMNPKVQTQFLEKPFHHERLLEILGSYLSPRSIQEKTTSNLSQPR